MYNQKQSIRLSLLLLALISSASVSYAQPDAPPPSTPAGEEVMLFQEIPSVTSASKYEQKLTEAPSSVSIVTASEIKKYGYRTLADILGSLRGFYVTYDRNYTYVGVRGFGRPGDYNNRMLLLIDGHRINDNLYDMAFIGTDGIIDVDLIDRVEVIRGPGSSLYGSNALFAVVNVITKRGRDLKGPEVSGEAGRYDTYKGRLTYGDRYQNGIEAIISGTGYNSKGRSSLYFAEYDAPATNNGITNHTDYDRARSFFGKTSYQDITLEGAYVSRTKGVPTASFQTDFNDPGNRTTDTRAYLDLRYDRNLGRQTDLTAKIYYNYYSYYGSYIYSGTMNKDLGYAESWGGEIKLSSRPFDLMRIILGTEYTYNNRQDQINFDVPTPSTSYLDDKRRSQIWAFYIQDEITLLKQLSLTAGVRYDHYDTFGGTTNPRLALIYAPLEKSVFKALYGSAFRAPSPFELYYSSSTNDPNPTLTPEKIDTYELVYEQYIGSHFRATITGFYYKIRNLINQTETFSGSGITVYRNIEGVRSRGLELGLENKWKNGIDARISYTLQRTIDTQTHEVLSNSPEHLVKLNVMLPLWKDRIFAGIEEQYTSTRRTVAGNATSDFFITNVTLYSQRIMKGLELSASVYNLFDKKYAHPVSTDLDPIDTVRMDGLTYRFKLTYAF